MPDPDLLYTFTCPNCAGTSSIRLERIPPVQARFPCPHCQRPMDFPSREEARIYAQLQVQNAAAPTNPPPPRREAPAPPSLDETAGVQPGEVSRFQVEKRGFESDVFARRGIRNMIRTGQVSEDDRVRVDQGEPVRAGEVPYLKSLFELRKNARGNPPLSCRTHTDKVAFLKCADTERPLCDECAPERKFGGTTVRVCAHCGGHVTDLDQA